MAVLLVVYLFFFLFVFLGFAVASQASYRLRGASFRVAFMQRPQNRVQSNYIFTVSPNFFNTFFFYFFTQPSDNLPTSPCRCHTYPHHPYHLSLLSVRPFLDIVPSPQYQKHNTRKARTCLRVYLIINIVCRVAQLEEILSSDDGAYLMSVSAYY